MLEISLTDQWRETFPGAQMGFLLLSQVDNAKRSTSLDHRKRQVEAALATAHT